MYILIIRTIILYFVALIIMRLMGKRQIGELQPFEIVLTVMISDLASMAMQDNRLPLIHSIIPMITLLILQVSTSILQLKSEIARTVFSGRPSILIVDGKVVREELKKQRINLNDLLEELRLKDIYNVEDVHYAILETSGQLSIIPKSHADVVTKKDLKIKVKQDEIPISFIMDGKINYENLKLNGKNLPWLDKQLKKMHINSSKCVFHAYLNSQGEFCCQLINKNKKGGTKKKI
ncbi:DUF421 domain-containing protein [Hathewaya proteolytica]|uniref:DUF421 domain-containing protein n=1 Tax=Hathewaya proteolytica TaxID=29365 RepID=UPI00093215B7|nr:DUF421 domain-containing protein [Hathewaya proteolytica]